MVSVVKNLPASAGDTGSISESGRSPGDPGVRKNTRMATHSNVLAWKIPWTEELWATVHGVTQSQTGLNTHTHTHIK